MGDSIQAKALTETYFKLVKRFPLLHIQGERQLEAAQKMIDQLLKDDLDLGASAYVDALTDLVEFYENEQVPLPDASEADVLRELMAANRLSQPKLAKDVGIAQSTISAVLTGSRSLTKGQNLALAKFFHVSPAVFFPS